jgi:AcrR family transcriptional regulator
MLSFMEQVRGRNRRGQGERLRAEIIEATMRLLDELGDDEALSLRAVARELGIAATSVYLHFDDRDTLVLAAIRQAHESLLAAAKAAGEAAAKAAGEAAGEAAAENPAATLRARALILGQWAQEHAGLYKVLHESTLHQRADMSFKEELAAGTTAAVQRCMDAGLAPAGDAALIALDLRAAVHGTVSMRVTEPNRPWPPLDEQIDRFLTKLVGLY